MNLTQIEKISKALADQTRLKIYEQIASHEGVHCCALVEMRGVTPATVNAASVATPILPRCPVRRTSPTSARP